MFTPNVSIGLPVYNGERYLSETLESLLTQTFEEFELIISDNGSTDGTEEICRATAELDARVRYIRHELNRGAAWNFNSVAREARGALFKLAAADDICAPTYLQSCIAAFDEAPPSVVVVYPRTVLIDGRGRDIGLYDDGLDLRQSAAHERLEHYLRHQRKCHPQFGLIRADVYRTTRGMGPFASADIVLLAELALRGCFWELDEPLFHRRLHDDMGSSLLSDTASYRRWWDPRSRADVGYRRSRLTLELAKSILHAPLPSAEKVRCARVFVREWGSRHGRVVLGEAKSALVHNVGRVSARARAAGQRPGSSP